MAIGKPNSISTGSKLSDQEEVITGPVVVVVVVNVVLVAGEGWRGWSLLMIYPLPLRSAILSDKIIIQ